jgi:hypothetical protein
MRVTKTILAVLLIAIAGCGSKGNEAKDQAKDEPAAPPSPASVKVAKKEATEEAKVGVKKIYAAARSFYAEAPPGATASFPKGDTGLTPPAGTCCKQSDGRCQPDPAAWNTPLWDAVKFSMEDPHHYSYQYVSDGTSFTARAVGDLDCDGVFSTFEVVGKAEANGAVNDEPAGMYQDKELE